MAAKDKKDIEDRFYNLLETMLEEKFTDIKTDIKEIKAESKRHTTQNRRMFSRLRKVEAAVFPKPKETINQLPPIWRDPQLIKLTTIVFLTILVALVIYAGIKGIALPKGLL